MLKSITMAGAMLLAGSLYGGAQAHEEQTHDWHSGYHRDWHSGGHKSWHEGEHYDRRHGCIPVSTTAGIVSATMDLTVASTTTGTAGAIATTRTSPQAGRSGVLGGLWCG